MMSSFLLFEQLKPIEVHYTELVAGGEKRYVIKVGEVGTVIKPVENNKWECIGKCNLDDELVQQIGQKIIEA